MEAALIDYLAITKLGTSDFCVSKAYVFLIGSYGAMWLGGKWCRKFTVLSLSTAAQHLMAMTVATSIAFLFSNGSFYWLSGRYPNGSFSQYVERVAMYYPAYLTSTLIYGVVIFALFSLAKSLLAAKSTRTAI
jgi:hypothetical protein